MDFGRKASYFTLDVISSLAFGKAFGDLERDEDVHKYIEMIEETGPSIILLTVLPWIMTLLQLPILKSFLPSAKDNFGFGKIMGQGCRFHLRCDALTNLWQYRKRNSRRKIWTQQESKKGYAGLIRCPRPYARRSGIRNSRSNVRSPCSILRGHQLIKAVSRAQTPQQQHSA